MMIIRKYQEKDKQKIITLVKEVLYELFKQKAKNIEDLNNIKKEYDIFYVAEDKNKIIGTIALKKNRLKRMYVKKQYRGKEISNRLLNKIIKFCKGKHNKIILTTYPQMKRAIEFYKENGFKEFKRNEQIWFVKEL